MTLTCGIDVGGTKIAGGVVGVDGELLEEVSVESPARDVAAIEATIVDLVATLRSRHDIVAVGVGAAGYVDRDRAVVMFAPNLAWRHQDLRGELEQAIGLRVVVENDANAAAWGEFAFGAAADVEDLLLVTVGTGVGGGIVVDGRLHRGAFGVAGEIGHLRVAPSGRLCGCGNKGCLEQYASGSALVRETRLEAAGGTPRAAELLHRAGGRADQITGPLITELALQGDPFCREQLATLGRWLGEGIASLVAVLDPAMIVIGGGVSAAGELLLEPVRTAFRAQLTGRGHRPEAELRQAALGNRAGMIGAADLARR